MPSRPVCDAGFPITDKALKEKKRENRNFDIIRRRTSMNKGRKYSQDPNWVEKVGENVISWVPIFNGEITLSIYLMFAIDILSRDLLCAGNERNY